MYWSSADSSGRLRLKEKSRKTFYVMSTKSLFFNLQFWGVWGGLQPGSPRPPLMRPCFVLPCVRRKHLSDCISDVVSKSYEAPFRV
jgi:hypothetical protein